MGPLRALAQDPVQNSYDAGHPSRTSPIGVEYQLHPRNLEGKQRMYLLTITDWNTTGLRGPALHNAGLINPDNCSGSFGDSGVATTLPHGLGRPKANRLTTPRL